MLRRKESPLFSGVSEKVEKAAREVSAWLAAEQVPHALIGGLAVNAYAEPRATRDVDLLVPVTAQAVLSGRPLAGNVNGITIRRSGVNIDLFFPAEDEGFLAEAVQLPRRIDGLPVAPPEVIVYLKMTAARGARDENDVINMIKAGLNLARARNYLTKNAPDLLEDFAQVVELAALESEP